MKFLFTNQFLKVAGLLLLVFFTGSLTISFAQSAPTIASVSKSNTEKAPYIGNGGIAVKLLDSIVSPKTINTAAKSIETPVPSQPRTAGSQFPFQVIVR